MLQRLLLVSASAIALMNSAAAADLAPVVPPAIPPVISWAGFYLGGQIGYIWGKDTGNLFVNGPLGAINVPTGIVSSSVSPGGVIGGAHVGYNWQANQLVFGLEGQVDGTNLSRTVQPLSYFSVTANSFVQGAILGRIGYAFDRTLIYATGGGVFTSIGNSYSVFGSGFTISSTRSGWTVGGGIEYALDNHWSIRGEYRYSNIKLLYDTPIFYTSLTETHHWTENQVKVGFSYKFGGPAPAPVIAKY